MKVNQYKQDRAGPITVSMKPALVEKLTAAARQRGQSRSAFIRALVVRELDRAGAGGQQDGQKG